MSSTRVAEMTEEELKELVQTVVRQTVVDLLSDPDEDLELREEMKDRLRSSLAATETAPAAEVAAGLGLD
ncbi:MAG: hypothetical protein GY719_18105 [bacterium]|nr:hypothetical protein [bacterium]